MVGNVWEWTDANLTVDNPGVAWSSGHSGTGDGTGWYTDDDGYWFTTTTGMAFIRGGSWTYGALGGCLATLVDVCMMSCRKPLLCFCSGFLTLFLINAPSFVFTFIGFRCCK